MNTTIKQKTIILQFETSSITVRRMYWKAARDFLKMLAKQLSGLGVDLANILPKLPVVIGSVDELSTFLIVNTTDLTIDQIDKLDVAQAAAILEAALELNAGDDLKNSFAGIAATLAGLMPAQGPTPKTKAGEESTPA